MITGDKDDPTIYNNEHAYLKIANNCKKTFDLFHDFFNNWPHESLA
jgi:hypothetical protein